MMIVFTVGNTFPIIFCLGPLLGEIKVGATNPCCSLTGVVIFQAVDIIVVVSHLINVKIKEEIF